MLQGASGTEKHYINAALFKKKKRKIELEIIYTFSALQTWPTAARSGPGCFRQVRAVRSSALLKVWEGTAVLLDNPKSYLFEV